MVHEFVEIDAKKRGRFEETFPLVFSLFMFILVLNVMIFPYAFTVTSNIVSCGLALLVFFTVIVYGFWSAGCEFLKLFVPSGIPIYILPLVTCIEVLSSLTRPSPTACGCSRTCWPDVSL